MLQMSLHLSQSALQHFTRLFARYVIKKKFEKVICAKGVHGRQWVNELSFSGDVVIFKEVS